MEPCEKNDHDISANIANTVEKQNKLPERSTEQKKLLRELTEMGFSESAVTQIVDNAGDVPKDLIIEQLLTSNLEPGNYIPVVEDDGDQLWEDINIAYKMVIVINTSLKMGVGKIASQTAHAALGLYEIIKKRPDLKNDLNIWDEQGSRKIVVEAKDIIELNKLCSAGRLHKIPFFCVHDAGLTEVAANSFTALAFFGSDDQLKPVTGKLRLLK